LEIPQPSNSYIVVVNELKKDAMLIIENRVPTVLIEQLVELYHGSWLKPVVVGEGEQSVFGGRVQVGIQVKEGDGFRVFTQEAV